MRVRRQPAALGKFLAKMQQMTLIQPALEEGARIVPRRSMALEINQITNSVAVATMEEMVEADFIQRGARGVRGDVAAESCVLPVGIDDHGHGVPPREALDAAFQFTITRIRRLVLGGNRVHIRRADGRRQLDPRFPQPLQQLAQHQRGVLRALVLEHVFQDEFERIHPPLVFAAILARGRNDRRFQPPRGWRTLLLFFCVRFHNVTEPLIE